MNIDNLISDKTLNERLSKLREKIRHPDHAISDVVDAEGHQYIDLVMEGGGMLGLALVGYSWALEQMGIRFFGIGGTSAGSINALLLAALDEPSQPKSPRLLDILANQNFYDFVDGGDDARDLIDLLLGGNKSFKKLRMFWKVMKVKKQLCTSYGLNKGDVFYQWLNGLLEDAGIKSLAQLERRLRTVPDGLRQRDGMAFSEADTPRGRLVIVAADVTTETRVEFPAMAKLYWKDPHSESPAVFARASMSIPFFFQPMRVTDIPQPANIDDALDPVNRNWKALAGYSRETDKSVLIPKHALFVDGGIMSNFPIDAFHNHGKVPKMPTFGVKLEYDQRYKSPEKLPLFSNEKIAGLLPLGGAIFNSSRHTLDYEFVKKNPDYKHLVQYIPCTYRDKQGVVRAYNWLDFNMPDAHKEGLFNQGALKAIEFVEQFSAPVGEYHSKWEFYKALRGLHKDAPAQPQTTVTSRVS